MGQRYTVKDVRTAAQLLNALAREAGILASDDELILQEGDKINGIAYRIKRRKIGTGGWGDVFGLAQGFLGWTAKEAYVILDSLYRGVDAAHEAAQRNSAG